MTGQDQPAAAPAGKKRVLIVDDDEHIREFLRLSASEGGFEADTAGDGVAALEKVKAAPPDLVVLDMMMPERGGFEVLRQLQEQGLSSLPVMVVSAMELDHSTVSVLRAEGNVKAFLKKPVSREEFVLALRTALGSSPAPGGAAKKKGLVLIVDDDEGILEFLAVFIKKEGYQVELAADGHAAFEKIKARVPDLLILDLMLPKQGGFEVLRQLQSQGLGHLPVIVITGRFTDNSTVALIRGEANVKEFFVKPLQQNALKAALQRILGPSPQAA